MAPGEIIKEFGLQKFGKLKHFAEAMEMSPPDLSQYLGSNARRDPGLSFLRRLYKLGFDVNMFFVADNVVREKLEGYRVDKIAELERENKRLRNIIKGISKDIDNI